MSSIITRPAFEGPQPLATTAPTLLAMNEAMRTMDLAQQTVQAYVDSQRRGTPLHALVWRKNIELIGFGKVWKDDRGHRTLHKVHVNYGEWDNLDARIAEALDWYKTLAERKKP